MEKKTIGQFIAVLRKANGLTQKQLAEKLNVSDKTVSRWERDETLPDLTLIPVLAEIFDVTSDEILRGERAGEKAGSEEKVKGKSEKQIQRMLDAAETKAWINTVVSISIAAVGLIVAMLCNFVFNRSYLGFFLSCIFYLGGAVYAVIRFKLSMDSLESEEYESEELYEVRRYVLDKTALSLSIILVLIAYTMPLFVTGASHWGLDIEEWIPLGIVFAVVGCIISCVVYINAVRLAKDKGLVYKAEYEDELKNAMKPKKRKIIGVTLVFVAITFVAHVIVLEIPDEMYFSGTELRSMDEVKEYLRISEETVLSEEEKMILSYDCFGKDENRIYDLENIMWSRKYDVSEFIYSRDNGAMIMTVYTNEEIKRGYDIEFALLVSCYFLYVIEIGVALIICFKKKRELIKQLVMPDMNNDGVWQAD